MSQLEAREIGARIKQRRLERGLTQEELAAMASFSARSLQDYETGVTIPYKHFAEIGRLLGTPSEWFLYGAAGDQAAAPSEITRLAGEVSEIRVLLQRVLGLRAEPADEPGAQEPGQESANS